MRRWTKRIETWEYPFPPPQWDGDNRLFVEWLIDGIKPRPEVRQVLRWAYGYDGGYDGTGQSVEAQSDGSTVVCDLLLGGNIKEPQGVGHDCLFHLRRIEKPDPSGHVWTWWESNVWYMHAMADFGYKWLGYVRFLGLTLGSWPVWIKRCLEQRIRRMRCRRRC
jgi:hypothetical protein